MVVNKKEELSKLFEEVLERLETETDAAISGYCSNQSEAFDELEEYLNEQRQKFKNLLNENAQSYRCAFCEIDFYIEKEYNEDHVSCPSCDSTALDKKGTVSIF